MNSSLELLLGAIFCRLLCADALRGLFPEVSVSLASLYLCNFSFKHAYIELVTAESSLIEMTLEIFPIMDRLVLVKQHMISNA